ncbi:methyl-accepting chemotaxis protein [Armatimonas sp.]|uniref:methyl-accepting chemotaxis protein n=1 Tax=Armatimonas sp. TaxID=1872638 RepID=UPI00286D6563|nr:methyl-accepting chemotaxis protein [Armatimonas sp.]
MKLISVTAVRNKLLLIVGAFLGSFILFGGVSWWSIHNVRIGGPYYNQIVQSKDLIADVLPPPEYLIESYLVALQLKDASSSAERQGLLESLKKLRADYDTRHAFWQKDLPEGSSVRTALLEKSHGAALRFFEVLDREYLPAVVRGDTARLNVLAGTTLKSAYSEHRSAVDNVVNLANQRYQTDETAAQAMVHLAGLALVVLSLVMLVVTGALVWWVSRGIVKDVTCQTQDLERARTELQGVFIRLSEVAAQVKQDADIVASSGLHLGSAVTGTQDAMNTVTHLMGGVSEAVALGADLSDRVAASTSQQDGCTREAMSALEGMLAAITRVSDGRVRQQTMAQEVGQEMQAAAQAVQAVTASAERFASSASRAASVARTGGTTVSETINSIRRIQEQMTAFSGKVEELGGKSGEIGGITATISTIARQTNLLALNATIEAARAREHGLGFSVVADEVRKLAIQVTEATTEISRLITGMRQGVAETMEAMVSSSKEVARGASLGTEAERSLEEILGATDELISEAGLVSTAAIQMESSVGKTQGAISEMRDVIAAGEGEMQTMTGQSQRVADVIQELRHSGEKAAAGAQELKATMHGISGSAQKVSGALENQAQSIYQANQATRELSAMVVGLRELAGTLQDETQTSTEPVVPLRRAA